MQYCQCLARFSHLEIEDSAESCLLSRGSHFRGVPAKTKQSGTKTRRRRRNSRSLVADGRREIPGLAYFHTDLANRVAKASLACKHGQLTWWNYLDLDMVFISFRDLSISLTLIRSVSLNRRSRAPEYPRYLGKVRIEVE